MTSNIENRVNETRDRVINPITPDFDGSKGIQAVKDFNKAIEDFRKWRKTQVPVIPEARFEHPRTNQIHKFRWTETGIEFI